jgi:hypothetical protein
MEFDYESTTQFTREYSWLFGQPPIRNVRAVRHIPGGILLDQHSDERTSV